MHAGTNVRIESHIQRRRRRMSARVGWRRVATAGALPILGITDHVMADEYEKLPATGRTRELPSFSPHVALGAR
jgi:hypothetical protein